MSDHNEDPKKEIDWMKIFVAALIGAGFSLLIQDPFRDEMDPNSGNRLLLAGIVAGGFVAISWKWEI